MIKVHHLKRSRSKRIIWLLEELAMPYSLINYERDPQTNLAPASLQQVHPLGKAPIIEHQNQVLCESGAITEYILNQCSSSPLRPAATSQTYYQYLEWMHFAEGSLALPIITTLLLSMEQREGNLPLDGYIAKELTVDFAYIDAHLAQQEYFAGDMFTAADIMMTIMLEIAHSLQLLAQYSNIIDYLNKIQKRPCYLKAASYG